LNHGYEFRRRLGSNAAGFRLIEYLIKHYSGFAESEWLSRIDSGRVLLDGVCTTADEVLRPGQLLSWIRPPWIEPSVPASFAILYRDDHLLGVAKPSGLPTLPGGGTFMENTLFHLVRRHYPAANPLHRLGRGTSGVVLFAMTSEAASRVSQVWRHGTLKIYRALVSGCPKEDVFEINVPIGPIPYSAMKSVHAASPAGKPAHSHVTVLSRCAEHSLVEVRITTGRPHQIRIHLAAAGYPLFGDPLYGVGGVPVENSGAVPGDLGYLLHNGVLGFHHPVSNAWTEITCMPPPPLRR
jgi:23S rRNA pseudouridine1911/1915/1917 synthase